MGRRLRFFGKTMAAGAAMIGIAAVCDAQAQQPSSLPNWLLFSPSALDSGPGTFVPASKDPEPAGPTNNRTNNPGEKPFNLAPLESTLSPSGRAARPSAPPPAPNFDGRMHVGGASLGFETETKIRNTPLRDENDTGFNDGNQHPTQRIPFIGLSIVSPIQ